MTTNKNIFVSIIMPTYNNDMLLEKSVKSVILQTYNKYELLIIDNNSTDKTSEIIASFNESRIKHIKIDNRGIIAKSRNLGIKLAKGEWVAFLDSDDIWYPERLAEIIKYTQKAQSYDVITTNEYKVFQKSEKKKMLFYGVTGKNKYKSLLLYGNRFSPSATVVRKDFIESNSLYFREDNDFITVEDYDFWLRIALNRAKFKFINSFHGEYLVHNNNSSGKTDLHNRNLLNLIKFHVYKLQEFDKDKNRLWVKISNFRQFAISLKNKNISDMLSRFYITPIFIVKVSIIKIIFRLRKKIVYFMRIKY